MSRTGGNVPSHKGVLEMVRAQAAKIGAIHAHAKEQMTYV